ncbi:MRS7 family protein [Coprinopsis cinerea okayama7|uniref:Mitochondrial proton/calcium exchanger protein n=1 Tax=Coprinopsis cinerea (strain Okayama-7 / 130 / ATCC MYA-4618 / FGSC 9003) TaxID=240176 RepID=A8NFL8_COPC7|nr:MRS7 family protein [Coprinopsis cinerea okayama7\|eukprot:XP_001833318.2 MRS7 family protein [Coprinopsis cinerea okayama7\
MSLWIPRSCPANLIHSSSRAALIQSTNKKLVLAARSRPLLYNTQSLNPPRLLSTSNAKPPPPSSPSSTVKSDSSAPSKDPEVKTAAPPAPKEPQLPLSTRVWKKVKHEAQHYWHGSKLLVSEVRISSKLQWKVLQGHTLTRRERRQLKRTTQDLMRLVPFSVFLVVPFMELLLPVALKLFPNMLPSTFEDKYAAEEKQRKLLRVRLDMAKFLQETLRESGLKANAHIVGSEAFKEFFRKVRATGEVPSSADVINVAKLFDDDLTLDNLSRPQLVSMSRYMGLNAFGTDNFLRGQIRTRLLHLRRDDQLIDSEGVDTLSTSELQAACQSRGIRTGGISPARLREELTTWIHLHLHQRVSGVLLILGRAFNFDRKPGDDEDGRSAVIQSLESVLSGLPDNLVSFPNWKWTTTPATSRNWKSCNNNRNSLTMKPSRNRRKKMLAELSVRLKKLKLVLPRPCFLTLRHLHPEVLETPSPTDARLTEDQLNELSDALMVLSSKSSVLKERDELRALMEENLQAEEDPKSPSGALTKRIRSMLTKIDTQLQEYDDRVGSSLQLIKADAQGRISVQDLEKAFSVIKHKPDEEVGQAVIQKLDVDQDGYVELEHVLGLVREEGLGIVMDDDAQTIIGQGHEIKNSKPRKEDIVQE